MLTDIVVVRILLGIFVSLLFLTHFWWVGDQWRHSSRAVSLGRIGLAGVFVYVLAGQVKGIRLDVPVDATSWLGVVGCLIGAVGFGWESYSRARSRRPKSGE